MGVLQSNHGAHSLDPLLSCSPSQSATIAPIDDVSTRFYARFLCADVPGVIGHLGTVFGDFGVSLASVVQIGFQDNLAEIVVVTHNVREGNFRSAIKKIQELEAIEKNTQYDQSFIKGFNFFNKELKPQSLAPCLTRLPI